MNVVPEFAPSIEVHSEITEKIDARGRAQLFLSPGGHTYAFALGGVRWEATPKIDIAPQIGMAINWLGGNDATPVVAIDAAYTIDRTLIMFDARAIFTSIGLRFSTYLNVDYSLHPFTVGAQIDQRDREVLAGPHVGLSIDSHLYFGFEGYVALAAPPTALVRNSIVFTF